MNNDAMMKAMNGPIPGENYTSDTRNYPWHRPPEYTDLDSAIEGAFEKLTDEDNAIGLLTMIDSGMTVAQATDIFLTSGIGAGKWTPDFAILMAGPVAHIIYLMAKGYGIDCDLGITKKPTITTSAFFKEARRTMDRNRVAEMVQGLDTDTLADFANAHVITNPEILDAAGMTNEQRALGGFMQPRGESADMKPVEMMMTNTEDQTQQGDTE